MKTLFVTSQQSRVVRAVSKTRFFMIGCLSLLTLLATEATAIDTVKPTVVITSPMAAQRIAAMSPYFTVRGTARDIGLGVTEVWCQINSGTFVPASGTNVWSCPVMLTEGLNKIRAYSRDAAGNYSPTQTVSCTYVPTTPIGISKTGNGTVGIYTNGQPLEIGRTYILTATPAAGFKLLNWTKNDIAAGTSASLSFLMQPNLTVCANFIDIGKPTVVIASPTAAQRIVALNPDFTVRGTARDIGAGVTEVWCQINNDTFVPASGTNVWSCPVTLTEGLNKIRAYSRDAAGNCSPTQTVSCTYVVTRPIGISMTGLGKVGVYTNGQPLEIGRTYTLTATPALGFKLLNWTYQGADIPFFYNGNIGAVLNGPTSPTVFTLATATTLSSLQTYHWNGGRGKSPLGTLSLSNSNGTVHGPWSVTGYPGQNGVSNAYWKATPNILLDAGTYTIIDSDPSTWSRNASSLGKGFAWANKAEGVATTPSFTFSMQSNLTVRANFIDIGKPVVAITAPTWGQRITAGSQEFTVRGTARDIGAGVTEVWCQLNNGAWQMAAGTNAWTHIVTLEAGPNTIKAYSKDAAGNSSPTQTVSCTYVATTPIRISKTGNGTVGSYTDGQLLEIGRAYTLTATPALGFKLLNWTMNDNVAGTALSFTFIMQPNLTVCANFIDTAKPTVVITSPTAAQRIVAASPEFTVLGKAGDIGLGVASVWCQLNSEGFVAVSGTNAWSCPVTLTAGLNTIKAYSMDAEGNSSLTQTVSCTYVVTTPIGISKTGNGTVGSYTDGQLLEIGRSYMLTATPAAGFKLLNWTVNGNVEGTSASLSFVMQPNLTVCANFIDTAKPTVVITSPTAAQRIVAASPDFTVLGKAGDIGLGVASVWCQLNSDDFVAASGTDAWSCPVTLTAGLNTIKAYSMDAEGNCSLTQTVSCTYVVTTPIGISKTGMGSVGIYTNGQPLEIGRAYTLTATPATGFVLRNWTTNDIAAGTGLSFSFIMQSNLTVCANFVDTGKPVVAITAPTAGQRITVASPEFTVRGTAGDIGAGVASVWCQLNSDGFVVASGTDAWSCPVTLTAGLNTIKAYSMDEEGNCSLTQTVSCTYVVATPIGISKTGNGTVGVYTDGQLLEIGRTYTLTATPATGFGLRNWTTNDIVAGTGLSFTFIMQPNLTVCANFVDTGKPVVAITAPTAGQRITAASPEFTVRGTASDIGAGVTEVWCQINSGEWQQPTGLNAWTNSVTLVAGPNSIRAYSMDAAGNSSSTSSVVCTYVVTTPIGISKTGLGTVGTYTNGQLLEIGTSYTLTATPATGFGLLNWTTNDIAAGTGLSFTFIMQSNLTVCANFVDTGKPVVAITAPTAGQRITAASPEFTVRGTASDIGAGVTEVWCQINNGEWQQATGTNAWTNIVTLEAGPNTIKAYSMDAAGNVSPTASVVCTYVVTTPIRISKTGNGTVGAYTDGQLLEIGTSYTLTATPATGFVLRNWTTNDNVAGTALSFTFIMQPNLTVCANFVDTGKPAVAITAPTAGQRITAASPDFTVRGTASDIGAGVVAVECQINNGEWQTATGLNAWTNIVTLVAGPNTIKAYSRDAAGNSSPTASVVCTYVVTTPIGISKTGLGTVGVYTNGQLLEIGTSYTLTATPATGSVLRNWTTNDNVAGTALSLTFIMKSNLTVCANFIEKANLNELTDAGLNALSEFVNTNSLTRGQAELVASAAADFDLVARNNPNNYTNRIYNAVAIMLNLINDPVVRSQAAAFGLNLNDLFDPTCVFPTVMPSVDITVDNLAASVLPAVDKAYTELNAVPATWTGMFEISPDKFPIDEAVWIDIGDVTAMKAALKGLRAFVGLLKAYNLNVDYRSLYDPTATPQAPIVVDGSDADWTNVTASLSSVNMADNSLMVTQEVAVALDQNQIALLMKGCPFVPADTFRIYFTLRLSNGDGLNSNRIFTVEMLSDSQVFGAKFNGQQFDNFEMKLVNGVLEVKFPIPDMLETSQVTVEVVEGTWSWGEMAFELEFPRDVPIKTIRANQPEFFSKVRNTTSLAAAKPDLLEALNGYLAADTLIVNRSGISTQLLHFVDFDVNDPAAVEDQQNKKFAVQSIRASLSGAVQVEGDSYIEGTVTRPVYLGAFFNAPYITTNIFPSGLRGTINNPVYDVFPDPTFHGILPGMTSVKLDKYLFGYTYASVETTTIIQDGENYPELNFYVDTDRMFMVITNVTVSGPSIPLPGMNLNWNGMSNDWNLRIPFTMPTKPGVGSVYTVTVYFSDGSQEQIERPITAWLAFSSTPTLSGSTLRWPAVTGAARYEVVDLVNDQSFEIPATQTSLDLSLYGYEPGYIPYLWIQAVDANWNSAGCMLNILE